MIYLAPPTFNFDGLIVMRDDTEPLQYYYYPSNPQLALNPDGSPTFLFVRFKSDAPVPPGVEAGGGFLNFDVDLRVGDDVLDDAKRQIRSQMNLDDNPRLVPLQYRNGATRLIFLDAAAPPATPGTATSPAPPATTVTSTPSAPAAGNITFVESASYAATPSLYGDNRAAFSVALTAQGATLVKACLDAPTFLAGVVYDLTFVGLRPAFHVSLVVDWKQAYSYMENQFHVAARVPFVALQSDIDAATEKLTEQRVIQINVVSYAAGVADADITKEKDAATDWVKKMVTDAFFKPSIPPRGLSGDAAGNKAVQTVKDATSPVSMGYSLKMLTSDDFKSMNVDMTEQDAQEVRIVPQGHLAGLMNVLKSQPLENYYREVDLNDPFFQRVRVAVSVANVFAADHIDSVIVTLSYAGANAQPISLTFTATKLADNASWELDPAVGMTYSYTVVVAFKQDGFAGDASQAVSPTITSTTPAIVIDPGDFYTMVNLDVQAPALPWDRYAEVQVALTAASDRDGSAAQSLTLTKEQPKATWSFRPADRTDRAFRVRKTYVPVKSPPVVVDWLTVTTPGIIVSDLDTDVLKVLVTTNVDFAKIPRILVTMAYNDAANNISQNDVLQLSSTAPLVQWAVPIVDRTQRGYTYAVTLQYADHTVKIFPPVPTSDLVLNIIDTFSRTMTVTVAAAGVDFDTAGLDRIALTLSYNDGTAPPATANIVLATLSDTGTFAYQVHDPARMAYTYSGTYFMKDGFNQPIASQTSEATSLSIPVRAPG